MEADPGGRAVDLVPNPHPPGWRVRLPGSAAVVPGSHLNASATCALTFDDGPDPTGTPLVLEALDHVGAKATFFLLADAVTRHASLARSIGDRGHEVALHADVHERLDRVPLRPLVRRLDGARKTIEDATGRAVAFHRPPFGRLSWRGLQACGRIGMRVAMWSHDPGDWRELDVAQLTALLPRCLVPGAVILLHDGNHDRSRVTAGAVRSVGPELKARGIRSVTLSDLD